MATLTFKGGVHPYDGKELSKDKAIVPYQPKGDLIYPVSQHIGAPASPAVNVGDMVKTGDVVGMPGNGLSVAVHASIDGKVVAADKNAVTIQRVVQ